MAEPTDAEKNRVWDLVEQIEDEMVKAEADWPNVRGWAHELAEHVDSFTSRPGASWPPLDKSGPV